MREVLGIMGSTLRSRWHNLPLSAQFVLAALAVLIPGMMMTGWWISAKVSEAVIRNTAAATAISMEGLLEPLVDEISRDGSLSIASQDRLDDILARVRADKRIVSMKIWKLDGTVIYSSFRDVVGRKFEATDNFNVALAGGIGADFDNEPHTEDVIERLSGVKLLEVYAPVRSPSRHDIVAVSEFYANGEQLGIDVHRAALESWLFVFAIATTMLGILSLIAGKGGRTIAKQRSQLETQVAELQSLLGQNEILRGRLRQANEDVSSINESVLRHVGADLHDGPAQKLAYIVMRLSSAKRLLKRGSEGAKSLDAMSRVLGDTLSDVRRMSKGLLLPELANLNLIEVVDIAITSHEEFTGSKVQRLIAKNAPASTLALRTCVYRLVQEGLTNASKHAGGKGQFVMLQTDPQIILEISDTGPGIALRTGTPISGLGLRGMQARVEALGGVLIIRNRIEGGTQLWAEFPATRGNGIE
jgi:signal transduction histidine kinase